MAEWHNSTAWVKAREQAKKVLEPICAICGLNLEGANWTIDHIIAPGLGEPNHDLNNLQSLCRACNGRKQDKTFKRVTWRNTRWQ